MILRLETIDAWIECEGIWARKEMPLNGAATLLGFSISKRPFCIYNVYHPKGIRPMGWSVVKSSSSLTGVK